MRAILFDEFPILCRRLLAPVVTLIVASVFIGGCSWDLYTASKQPQAEVVETADSQWDTPFDRMGVVPITPPSEDIRVGDIFVYPFNPDLQVRSENRSRRNEISISPRWDSINILQDLEEEYRLRPDWPTTPAAHLQLAIDPQADETAAAGTTRDPGLFSPDRVAGRLRIIGTPELNTFVLSDAQANEMVPSEAVNLVFGSAWNDNKTIAIRINSAETYSLGLRKIITAALDESGPVTAIREPYRNQLSLVADPEKESVWVRILSDVVYVRSIDIIIQSTAGFDEDDAAMASEFVAEGEETTTVTEERQVPAEKSENQAGSAGAAADGDAANLDDAEAAGEILHSETVSAEIADHELDPAYAAFVRANAINEMLIAANADDLSEGYLRFVSVTDDSVTVRRVWKYGLAIGARGLSLEVDKATGAVLRSGNMGTLIP